MLEGDPRLAYYDGKRAFEVFEKVPPKKPVAPSLRPKKAKPAPKPAKVAAAPDLGAEEAPPLAEPAPEIDDEGPPGPSIPADEELAEWLKKPLVELAVEYGLDVSGMTKPEIRAAIDKIR